MTDAHEITVWWEEPAGWRYRVRFADGTEEIGECGLLDSHAGVTAIEEAVADIGWERGVVVPGAEVAIDGCDGGYAEWRMA